ncbi:MAG: LAGLIDADG family homing endonuclease, partial [Candidatus Nanoarchaeia archaeon]
MLFLGLYGAGKCVHEKTKIQLSGGDIIKAKDIYNKYKNKLKEESLEDGKIINIEDEELLVPSYNPLNQQIENKRVTHLWKLKKDELMEVKLNNGNDFSIKVTPEHPFFVLQNGEVTQKRADQLTEQDFISIPNRINIIGRQVNIFDEIKNLNLDVYLSKEEIKDNLPKDKTLKEVCQSLKHKRNYCHFTKTLKEGKLPIELINSKNHNFLKIKDKNSKKIISLPLFITPEFAEFIGYVIGDGNLRENSIGISSEDSKVIKRVIELSKILFNITPSLIKDKRTNNLYQIRVNSNTLVKIFKIFGLTPGRKGKNLYIPNQITQSNDEIVRSFLRAYFDCDSHPSKNKRYIELTSESHIILQQIHMLLKRFGIISTISKKMINKIPYWRLSIKARYAEQYSNKIGYLIKRKQKVIEKYSNMGLIQGSGNQDMIPLGKTLKALRLQLGFSIGEIQSNAVYSYGIYEEKGFISKENLKKLIAYYKIKKKGFIWEILQDIANNIKLRDKYSHEIINGTFPHLINENLIEKTNGQLLLTEKSQKILQLINENQIQFNNIFSSLEKIADSNICWLPVKEINKIKNNSEYVYDLTVEDNHSFVAEGFIVHNTTTIAKLGNYFQKRGNKVALVGLDVHRPAAKEQLKQLAEKNNLTSFIDEKEADAIQTWKNFEPKLKDYNVVLIDTAGRHTLDQELITEISSLNRAINPTEAILVMPADIGQAAKPQAEQFKEALQITGVIITRMDSTAKGGGALTACAETH